MAYSVATYVRALKFEEWPDLDRQLFEDADRPNLAKPDWQSTRTWASRTRALVCNSYGIWLFYLATYHPYELSVHPQERVRRETIDLYVTWLCELDRKPCTIGTRLLTISQMLSRLVPNSDFRWLSKRARDWYKSALKSRNIGRFSIDPKNLLENCILELDKTDHASALSQVAKARRYRDLLILTILTVRGWRTSNLRKLDIDNNVVASEESVSIMFKDSDTKNRSNNYWPIPKEVGLRFVRYLKKYRGTLCCHADQTAVWPGQEGAISEGQIRQIVRRISYEMTGEALTPREFRYILATAGALAGPEAANSTPIMLGHSDTQTSRDFYVIRDQTRAHGKYLDSVFEN